MDSVPFTHAPITRADQATLPAHAMVLVAALAAGVAAQGGYYLPGRVLITVAVGAALALAWRAHRWSRGDAWPVAVASAALGLWALARATTAGDYPSAIGAVATLGCLAAVLVAMRRTGSQEREHLAEAAISIGVLVAVTAWIGVAWRVPRFAVLVEGRLWRGASTLTYPNAAAALLAPLALLAIALLVARPGSLARAAGTYLLLVGVGAALSRAGFIAFLAGFVVLAALAGLRATVAQAVRQLIGAGIAVGALVPSFPVAAQPRPALAVLGLLAGAVVAIGPVHLPGRARAAALVATLAFTGIALSTQLHSGYLQQVLASRATLDSSGRTRAAQAAVELVSQHPLIGTGIGRASFFWTTPQGNGALARYAHNEYLQLLVDLGFVGFALLLGLVAAIVLTVRRGRATPHRPGVMAGAVAALAALAVHSGFDFLWHITVLPLTGALFIGLAGPAISEEPVDLPQKGRTQ